jgi:hypothetical protein
MGVCCLKDNTDTTVFIDNVTTKAETVFIDNAATKSETFLTKECDICA